MIVTQNRNELNSLVADLIGSQLKTKPDSTFGLPTGKSIAGCYQILMAKSSENLLDWSGAKCFALDDYLEVEESYSFQTFLTSRLYRYTNINPKHCFNPRFQDNYDQLIASCGGLDLCVLGLGGNGHIAYNEPGTPEASWTHCLWLSDSTKMANSEYFRGSQKQASLAITMGIATILASLKIILVATGKGKKEILAKALSGAPCADLPASFLTLHPNLTVVTDFHS
jgi:glucosamine-6-phosphate deaminase